MYVYVKRKVRIRTILEFCYANLGSELCAIILGSRMQMSDPKICCANLGSADFAAQASDMQSSRTAQPNVGHPRIARITIYLLIVTIVACRLHAELECVHDCTIDRASLPPMGELLCVCDRLWLLCRRRSNCFVRAIGCRFVSADGRAASLA